MLKHQKTRYDLAGNTLVKKMQSRHYEAYYCSNAEDAAKKVLELIPEGDVVSWGGTMTVDELGIKKMLADRNQPVIDRDTAKTPEERADMLHKALLCDTFLMSSNAITEEGELLNIDGTGNRVAALCYGPRQVIVVAGMNKVVEDIDAAYSRARHIAATANIQRFDLKTPCSLTGFCKDCTGDDCVCAQVVITRVSRPAGRIKVVLVGEDLGF